MKSVSATLPAQLNMFEPFDLLNEDKTKRIATLNSSNDGRAYYRLENRRYTGSKAKLIEWIMGILEAKCPGESFVDIFAGTGVVAQAASGQYSKIVLNDTLHSNFVAYQAFFARGQYSQDKLEIFAARYNSIKPRKLKANYVSTNFGGKYFSIEDAKIIGFIRQDLEDQRNSLTSKEFNILLTSLMYSADKIANTVGHYDAFFRNCPEGRRFKFTLAQPGEVANAEIYEEDANDLANTIKADVVYLDPPYNSRQYNRFYHVLENLVQWNQPELFGTALKPVAENSSEYCKSRAPKVLADLVQRLDCKYIVLSYNNTYKSKSSSSRNKITLEQIQDILYAKGPTERFEKNHKFFNTGKTEFDDHKEYLFVCQVQ